MARSTFLHVATDRPGVHGKLVAVLENDGGRIFPAHEETLTESFFLNHPSSMRCWQTWHWKKATKGSFKPSNYGFDPIRPRNVIANCLTEFSRVWAYNPILAILSNVSRSGCFRAVLK
jgi:hypothetical protein